MLALALLENHVDGFLFGIADETTGVDDADVTAADFGVVGDGEAGVAQLGHQALAVDEVLGAAHREDVNMVLFHLAFSWGGRPEPYGTGTGAWFLGERGMAV